MAIFYEDVLRALDAASIRFVVVGGVAVILHGVPRSTADLDLVIDLEEGNVRRFIGVMAQLGFVPRAGRGGRPGQRRSPARLGRRQAHDSVYVPPPGPTTR